MLTEVSLIGSKTWAVQAAGSTPLAQVRLLKDLGKWVQEKIRIFSFRKLKLSGMPAEDDHVSSSSLIS